MLMRKNQRDTDAVLIFFSDRKSALAEQNAVVIPLHLLPGYHPYPVPQNPVLENPVSEIDP